MADEEIIKNHVYLMTNGWYYGNGGESWSHRTIGSYCCLEVAMGIQKLRDNSIGNRALRFIKREIFRIM